MVLRSSLELHSRSTTSSATDSLDLSSEFLSLEDSGRRRPSLSRASRKSTLSKAAAAAGVSTGLGRRALGPWGGGDALRGPAPSAGLEGWKVLERQNWLEAG